MTTALDIVYDAAKRKTAIAKSRSVVVGPEPIVEDENPMVPVVVEGSKQRLQRQAVKRSPFEPLPEKVLPRRPTFFDFTYGLSQGYVVRGPRAWDDHAEKTGNSELDDLLAGYLAALQGIEV